MDMGEYIENSARLIEPFRNSEAGVLVAQIMRDRTKYEDRKISAGSRDVYRIGSFAIDGQEHHALLKLERGLAEFSRIAFEAYFFGQCSLRDDVKVPAFVMLPRAGLTQGVVMEDLSEGERYSVEQLVDMEHRDDLGFVKEQPYRRAEFEFMHNVVKVEPIILDDSLFSYFIGEMGKDTLRTTAFAVYDKEGFKRIVCADIDQLYHHVAKLVDPSKIADLERLVFDLGSVQPK